MIHATLKSRYYAWILVLFASSLTLAPIPNLQAQTKQHPLSSHRTELRFEDDRISGTLKNAALIEVFEAFEQLAGLRYRLADALGARWAVSITFEATRLDDAVRQMLKGFSYALISQPQRHEVIVLSTPPKTLTAAILEMDRVESSNRIADAEQSRPQHLDEFQSIGDKQANVDGQAGDGIELSVKTAEGQDLNDAMLQRALNALNSGHEQLYGDALSQLGGLHDPRAGAALAEMVSSASGFGTELRLRAVAAFIQNAENSRFSDPAHVQLLTKLSNDGDVNVRGIAGQALLEMQGLMELE